MNEHGRDLMRRMLSCFGMVPGATSMSLTASERWAVLLVRTTSDEAVVALSKRFGLTCNVRVDTQKWWHRATGEAEQGLLQIVIAGPPHED